MLKKLLILPISIFLLSCAKQSIDLGKTVDPTQLATIKVAHTSKKEVAKLLGSPTFASSYEDVWYYANIKGTKTLFFDPKIKSITTIEIKFKNDKVLAMNEIIEFNPDHNLDPDRTKTIANDDSKIKHFVNNFRKFTTPMGSKRATEPGHGF